MLRSTALVALLATVTATGGCAMTSGQRSATVAGGLALSALGVLAISNGSVDSNHNGVDENPFDNNLDEQWLGMYAVAAGALLFIAGVTSRDADEGSSPAAVTAKLAAATQPTIAAAAASPSSAPPPLAYVSPGSAPVLADAERLPELPASAPTLQLAKQVRTASARGKCDAAWIMWNQLDDLDARYAEALRAGPVMNPCVH